MSIDAETRQHNIDETIQTLQTEIRQVYPQAVTEQNTLDYSRIMAEQGEHAWLATFMAEVIERFGWMDPSVLIEIMCRVFPGIATADLNKAANYFPQHQISITDDRQIRKGNTPSRGLFQ